MKRIVCFFAFVCLLASMAVAQNAQLSGVVKDKTGAVVPQAEVTLKNIDTAGTLRTKTSKVGFFVFPSVQPGRFDLSAVAKGFDETVINGIKIDTAANVSQDLILQIKQGAETVTVTQQAGLVAEDGTVSTVIDQTQIESMPLNGKDLTTLFELSPGTLLNAGGSPSNGGGFSVDGQRPTANNLTIDGASANAYVPVSTGGNLIGAGIATSASGGTNGILPVDALEEYRMDTSTYTAENGRTPGAQILVRTRSGTNEFHGTLFENFRNQVLDATDWFVKYDGVKQSPLRMNDFGGTLGGPLLKDKLFFFVANDNLVLDQPNTSTEQDVPGSALISQAYSAYKAIMAGFPAGNTAVSPGSCPSSDPYCDPSNPGFDFFSQSYPYQIRDHTTSIRIDEQYPHSIHSFFRANIAPSTSYLPGIVGNGSQVNIYTYTGGLIMPLGHRMVDELTVNRTIVDTSFLNFVSSVAGNDPNALRDNLPTGVNPTTDVFYYELNSANYGAYPYMAVGPDERNSLSQWNIVNNYSANVGRHSLKFGLDTLAKTSHVIGFKNEYALNVNLENTTPYTDLDTGVISQMTYYHRNGNPNISIENTSIFANDDWRISKNLTLNVGIRWEYNPPPSIGPIGSLILQGSSLAPGSIQAVVSTKPEYKTLYTNFAPRFGFAWTPTQTGSSKTVIRGGVGIYFDTGQAATSAGLGSGGYPYTETQNYNELQYSSVNWASLYESASPASSLPLYQVYLINPNIVAPRTYEWSLTVERQIGQSTKVSVSYVGNDGEQLIGEDEYYNSANSGGQYPVNTALVSKGGSLFILTNQSHSNYQALQTQLTMRIGKQLNALASYTWGHAEDNGSTDFSSVGSAVLNPIANSAFDIRHMFAAAIHYTPSGFSQNHLLRAATRGWGFDTIARLQTATPLTVTVNDRNPNAFLGNADVVEGENAILHEHIDSYGQIVPGNRLLNWDAFTAPPEDSEGNLLRQGDSPTNGYRLFGLTQWDMAASRNWKIWNNLNLTFRVDAYNLLNTANFAAPNNGWSPSNASTFGIVSNTYASTYGSTPANLGQTGAQLSVFQNGGPRELQLSVKLKF